MCVIWTSNSDMWLYNQMFNAMEQKGHVCPMYKKYKVVFLWIVMQSSRIKYTMAAMTKIDARVNKYHKPGEIFDFGVYHS